jgi:hypothetical protein
MTAPVVAAIVVTIWAVVYMIAVWRYGDGRLRMPRVDPVLKFMRKARRELDYEFIIASEYALYGNRFPCAGIPRYTRSRIGVSSVPAARRYLSEDYFAGRRQPVYRTDDDWWKEFALPDYDQAAPAAITHQSWHEDAPVVGCGACSDKYQRQESAEISARLFSDLLRDIDRMDRLIQRYPENRGYREMRQYYWGKAAAMNDDLRRTHLLD